MNTIETGTILIQDGTLLPESLTLESAPYSTGWTSVTNVRAEFLKDISRAGWTFFFMAGKIEANVFGFDRKKSVQTAAERIIADAEAHHCNCVEITQLTMKSFLGFPYASISAHSRHVQGGSVFGA